MQGELFDKSRPVDQLHWGGGTPTFLNAEQMTDLMRVTGEHFRLRDDDTGEYSIEIDPREADRETVTLLRNRSQNAVTSSALNPDEPSMLKGMPTTMPTAPSSAQASRTARAACFTERTSATRNGVASFDPSRIEVDSQPLAVSIERIIVNREPIVDPIVSAAAQPLALRPGSGERIEFHFTATSLVAADRVRFRPRLEG